jgi:AcrR family transcriptional regulator
MEGTKGRLIEAASQLLDSGGESAVTLRAVAEAVGVSHNAPYRHFRDRNALLAAVAERDLVALSRAFRRRRPSMDAKGVLKIAIMHFIAYGRAHPARYRLLFSGPEVCVDGSSMQDAARDAFDSFGALVAQCKRESEGPPADCLKLAGLIYATVRGALDLELSGHAKERNGLDDLGATVDLLLNFIWPPPASLGAARNSREIVAAESL